VLIEYTPVRLPRFPSHVESVQQRRHHMDTISHPSTLITVSRLPCDCILVSGLECYACNRQDGNIDKCIKTTKQCEENEDICRSTISWERTYQYHWNVCYNIMGTYVTISWEHTKQYHGNVHNNIMGTCVTISWECTKQYHGNIHNNIMGTFVTISWERK